MKKHLKILGLINSLLFAGCVLSEQQLCAAMPAGQENLKHNNQGTASYRARGNCNPSSGDMRPSGSGAGCSQGPGNQMGSSHRQVREHVHGAIRVEHTGIFPHSDNHHPVNDSGDAGGAGAAGGMNSGGAANGV